MNLVEPDWLESYTVPPAHVEWASNLVKILTDQSSWTLPMNGHIYFIDKTERKFTLVLGRPDEVFWMNLKTFARIGYTVEYGATALSGVGRSTHTRAVFAQLAHASL